MTPKKSYTIHTSKKSQVDKDLHASPSLLKLLKKTPHRLDFIEEIKGVEFMCDARSADLLSTRDTFKCIEKPIIWLSATTSHDRDYALIEKYVKYKVKAVVVYGGAGTDMNHKLSGMLEDFKSAETLPEATKTAYGMASEGDCVLFSPSCVAQDDYRNFVDRAAVFTQTVREIKES
jgi:UDP-N-acetylmuramoylalanine--D-glutamate ligase